MPAAYTLTQAQKKLPALVRESRKRAIPLTKDEKVVGFLLSKERMESLLETVEIMQDKKAMKAIREYEAGKTQFHPLSALG